MPATECQEAVTARALDLFDADFLTIPSRSGTSRVPSIREKTSMSPIWYLRNGRGTDCWAQAAPTKVIGRRVQTQRKHQLRQVSGRDAKSRTSFGPPVGIWNERNKRASLSNLSSRSLRRRRPQPRGCWRPKSGHRHRHRSDPLWPIALRSVRGRAGATTFDGVACHLSAPRSGQLLPLPLGYAGPNAKHSCAAGGGRTKSSGEPPDGL